MLKDYLIKENGMKKYLHNLQETFKSAKKIVLFGGGAGGGKYTKLDKRKCA